MTRISVVTLLGATLIFTIACTQEPAKEPAKTDQAPAAQSTSSAAPAGKKEHVFRGKIEAVDPKTKSMTVNGENVEGWMSAMTMQYSADKDDVYEKVKPGDQITAKVYDGDFGTLHDVQVVK